MKVQIFSRKPSKASRKRRGVAAVEMALVAPVFFVLVLGIIEFGRAFMVTQLVTNAARDAARQASVDGSSNSAVSASVNTFLVNALGITSTDVTINFTVTSNGVSSTTADVSTAQEGDECMVEVAIPFNSVSFMPGNFLEGTNLAGMASMRHE